MSRIADRAGIGDPRRFLGYFERFVSFYCCLQKLFRLRQLAYMEASHGDAAFTPAREIKLLFDVKLEILTGRDGLDVGCDCPVSKAHSNSARKFSASTSQPSLLARVHDGRPTQACLVHAARRAA